jgi:mannose-1-phosphate guanylyltransferase
MADTRHLWSIVLAAGEGSRLRDLTIGPDGAPVPKQYWKIDGNATMLRWTLNRAARLTSRFRIVPVVAAGHRRHWENNLSGLPTENILVQPENRGTAAGILLPLLNVLSRDPRATVITLPSDHYVEDEMALENSLRRAADAVAAHPERVVLIGITPDHADPELGYLVPAGSGKEPSTRAGIRPLRAFVEKPPRDLAARLLKRGAAWNSFVMVAKGTTLVRLFERTQPDVLDAFSSAVGAHGWNDVVMEDLYSRLPVRDFSRDVLQEMPSSLWMVVAPRCGWSDLGTPERVRSWRASIRGRTDLSPGSAAGMAAAV